MSSTQYLHRPNFTFRMDGSAASEQFMAALSGWRVAQKLSTPSVCELHFDDPAFAAENAPKLGSSIKLEDIGRGNIFDGEIATLHWEKCANGARRLIVRATDKLENLRRGQVAVSRSSGSLSAMVESFAREAGATVSYHGDDFELPLMIQWGANNLEWLANISAVYGRYFYLDGSVLKVMSLEGDGAAVECSVDDKLFEITLVSNATGLRTEATATGWNPLTAESVSAQAMDFTLDIEREWENAPEALKDVARDIVGGATPLDDGASAAVAIADLERAAKHAHSVSGLCEGDPQFKPGSRMKVLDASGAMSGEFVLTEVHHIYAAESGYVCEFSSRPPQDPRKISPPPISLGVVSDTNDPQNAGRMRVKLPAFNDLETDWLFVCSAGAGEGKGMVVQPEVDDRVIIAFASDNPAQGVVLGGVYGATAMHDGDVGEARPRPYSLRTSDGQSVRLDDQAGSVRLASRGGAFALDPKGVLLHADADMRIEAPGRRIVIVADKIDFEQG